MPSFRSSLLAVLLLPLLAGTVESAVAREVAAPARHVAADGPYVFRDGTQLQAKWICADKVETRAVPATAGTAGIAPRCGYAHPVHVLPPNAPAVPVLPAAPRIVALSDIHGQYGLLVRLLRAHGVIDAQDRWAMGKDTLVVAGDVFDRGAATAKPCGGFNESRSGRFSQSTSNNFLRGI
mgnify:CR=1 FL=1